jgi:hypothetical protein
VMSAPFAKHAALGDSTASPFTSADAMREPIFYGAESAYSFQYRDLSNRKYALDVDWLERNKGFSIEQARIAVNAILGFFSTHLRATLLGLRALPPDQWTLLNGFTFALADIRDTSGLLAATVRKVLEAFTFAGDGNPTFTALQEFNAINAFPLLRIGDDRYILFQGVTERASRLAETLTLP